MEQIARLCEVIGTSRSQIQKRPWSEVEHALGLSLPSDYKAWGDAYPSLSFGNAISVHNYQCLEGHFRSEIEQMLSTLQRGIASDGVYRVFDSNGTRLDSDSDDWTFYPEIPGLLGWGYTVSGNSLMWHTEGEPDNWRIVLGSRDLDLHVFDCGFTEFLMRIIDNELGPRLDSSRWMSSLSPMEMWGYKDIVASGREFRAFDFRPI